jgi:hypothetical protein
MDCKAGGLPRDVAAENRTGLCMTVIDSTLKKCPFHFLGSDNASRKSWPGNQLTPAGGAGMARLHSVMAGLSTPTN